MDTAASTNYQLGGNGNGGFGGGFGGFRFRLGFLRLGFLRVVWFLRVVRFHDAGVRHPDRHRP